MEKIGSHKDLNVWKRSIDFVMNLYSITKSFPKEEKYCLTSQIRRSGVSIPSNIAEGAARKGKKEFSQFLYISLGSLSELETQLIIADKLKYFTFKENLKQELIEIRRMLQGLIKKINN